MVEQCHLLSILGVNVGRQYWEYSRFGCAALLTVPKVIRKVARAASHKTPAPKASPHKPKALFNARLNQNMQGDKLSGKRGLIGELAAFVAGRGALSDARLPCKI